MAYREIKYKGFSEKKLKAVIEEIKVRDENILSFEITTY